VLVALSLVLALSADLLPLNALDSR
jgi:hypothetical protein